jgi:hypothetical protein
VLIGLNPIATQLRLADNAEPFGGFGGPVPLLETPSGGANIVSGIGLATGAGNARAVACKWMAGEKSYLGDVKFIGGHGNLSRPGTHPPTPTVRPASSDPGPANWDSQYWSLWITNGGGGTFKDIWTANTDALAGVYISRTATPGRIYALSVEHHVRNEIRFNRVANWKVYALQLEEESRESSECQPMELQDCNDMVFANLYMFRVIRVNRPYPWSIRKWGGSRIELLNVHNYSQTKFTTTAPLYDVDNNTEIRPWEFARLSIGDEPASAISSAPPPHPRPHRSHPHPRLHPPPLPARKVRKMRTSPDHMAPRHRPRPHPRSPRHPPPSANSPPASNSRRAYAPTPKATSIFANPASAASIAGRPPPEASRSSQIIPGNHCPSPAIKRTTCSSSLNMFLNPAIS